MQILGEVLVVPFLLVTLVAMPPGAAAQAIPATPDSATIEAAKRTLRSDLRNFVTVQESYFADHGTYARSLRSLSAIFEPSAGVTILLLTTSDKGHSEVATDKRVPGLVCAMHVGTAAAPLGLGREGEVVCRDP